MTTDIERGGIEVGGSHEPSYYEIALTNRQVVVAFVILLTCVVAAFFSGVWIGRESAARAQERLALLGRGRAVDGANADADKAKQEGQALQEFKFFADSRQRPAAAREDRATKGAAGSERPAAARVDRATMDAAGSRTERSTLADDLHHSGGSEAPAAPAGKAAAAAAPRAASGAAAASAASAAATRNRRDSEGSSTTQASQAPAAAEAAGEGEPLPVTPPPAARAARGPRTNASSGPDAASAGKPSISWSAAGASPAGASPAAAGAQPSGATASSSAAGEVVIQVFSTADKEQADKVRDGLVHAGFTAFLSPIAKGGQTMYRVRIGPFPSRTAAEPVAEKVRKERKLDTWITPK
jgi:cell division septation protein DedD